METRRFLVPALFVLTAIVTSCVVIREEIVVDAPSYLGGPRTVSIPCKLLLTIDDPASDEVPWADTVVAAELQITAVSNGRVTATFLAGDIAGCSAPDVHRAGGQDVLLGERVLQPPGWVATRDDGELLLALRARDHSARGVIEAYIVECSTFLLACARLRKIS